MDERDYKIVPFDTLPDGARYVFWGSSTQISSNFTGIDWGKYNPELAKRTKRVNLDDDENDTS